MVITQLGYNPKEEYEKVLQEKEPRVGQIAVTLKPKSQFPQNASSFIQDLRPALAESAKPKSNISCPRP